MPEHVFEAQVENLENWLMPIIISEAGMISI